MENKKEEVKEVVGKQQFNDILAEKNDVKEMFQDLIKQARENLVRDKSLCPVAILVIHDIIRKVNMVRIIPMMFENNKDKDAFSNLLRILVKHIEQNKNLKIQALITMMECFISVYEKDKIPGGSLAEFRKTENYVAPSNDPQRKEVLYFAMEEEFKVTTVVHEFMRTSDDEIVVRDIPYMESVRPYNQEEAQSRFGFIFTKGSSQN